MTIKYFYKRVENHKQILTQQNNRENAQQVNIETILRNYLESYLWDKSKMQFSNCLK